jgi:hypothetical protein
VNRRNTLAIIVLSIAFYILYSLYIFNRCGASYFNIMGGYVAPDPVCDTVGLIASPVFILAFIFGIVGMMLFISVLVFLLCWLVEAGGIIGMKNEAKGLFTKSPSIGLLLVLVVLGIVIYLWYAAAT